MPDFIPTDMPLMSGKFEPGIWDLHIDIDTSKPDPPLAGRRLRFTLYLGRGHKCARPWKLEQYEYDVPPEGGSFTIWWAAPALHIRRRKLFCSYEVLPP